MVNETGIPHTQNPIQPQNPIQTQAQTAIRIQSAMQSQQAPGPSTSPQIQTVRATPELHLLIQSIVDQKLANNNKPELEDERITDKSNLDDLDRTPDIVKAIRDFSGEPGEYTAWRTSVDRIFDLYGHLRGTAKYYGILSVIRTKIIGNANSALTSHNAPLNWTAIKQCLNTHYADRRHIGTLDYQLTSMVQGSSNIETFYQKVYGHLTLLLNSIAGMELDKNAEAALIDSYRNKALDTFIRGLNGDLPRLLAVREPTDLPQALHLCTKLANQNYRANYAHNSHKPNNPPQVQRLRTNQNTFYPEIAHVPRRYVPPYYETPPPLPPRISYGTQFQNHNPLRYPYNNHSTPQQNNYRPQAYNYPTQYYNTNQPQAYRQTYQYRPPRPLAPKPLPPPEPMDVDHSIRSQIVNYANRPKIQPGHLGKRFNSQNAQFPPQKVQRNFHINTIEQQLEPQNFDNNPYDLTNLGNCLDTDSSLAEYVEQYNNQYTEPNMNYIDVSDVHFLD